MLYRRVRIALLLAFPWLFLSVGLAHSTGDPKLEWAIREIAKDYQAKVEPLFRESCFDCHSSFTRYPWYHRLPVIRGMIDEDIAQARKHLDMSNGFPFQGEVKLKSGLKAIAYQVAQGKMPLFQYRWMHPQSALTDGQKQDIEDWVDRSLDRLDQAGE